MPVVARQDVAASRFATTSVWIGLLLLAAAGWAVVALQVRAMAQMQPGMDATAPAPVSVSLLLFLPVWLAMMMAMMFPSVAPVVSLFAAAGRARRVRGGQATPTWVFVAGYLSVWSLFGLGAFLLSMAVPALGMAANGLRGASALAGGAALILAGLYQWSPLKQVCLRHCRSPLGVLLHRWRGGRAGAFRMGFSHGAYCLGCCWGLMLVLFAVGLMNIVAMVVLTGVIFAEKVVPHGPLIGKAAAVALVLYGVITIVAPMLH